MKTVHDALGREIPDPTPVAIPAGFKEPETLQAMMARMVRQHMTAFAQDNGMESEDEANDFDIDEDGPESINTPYQDMGDETLAVELEQRREQAAINRALEARRQRASANSANPAPTAVVVSGAAAPAA